MKYFIITFGCQMNKSDSERIATVLEKDGYQPASKETGADLVVVNMCSVRQSAVDRVYGLFPKFKKLREKNPKLKTILTGCILKKDRTKFTEGFDKILKFKDLLKYQPKYQYKPIAYIPISNGCNNFCSYCVVPFVRGPLVCRDHQEILEEVKDIIKNGFKEIWLLGQNVNDYQSPTDSSITEPRRGEGGDEGKLRRRQTSSITRAPAKGGDEGKLRRRQTSSINFAKLLKMVDDISGDFKILFTSPHPMNFSEELINTLSESEKFGKYLNLPVQSGDNKILKKMNRNYNVEEYKNLVKKIREKIPGIKLSTDVIVGFPGETKKQFQNTVKLFKEIKFDNAYIAKYSPRPGTAAFKMKDDIPLKEKKRREKTLRKIIERMIERPES